MMCSMTPRRSRAHGADKLAVLVAFTILTAALATSASADCRIFPTQVVVESPQPIDAEDVRRLIDIQPGVGWCTAERERAKQALLVTGLYKSVEIDVSQSSPDTLVTVRIERWPLLNSLSFRGNDGLSTEDLRQTLHLNEGDILREGWASVVEERLIDRYREEGYPDARIEVISLIAQPGELAVRVAIVEGPALRIEELVLTADPRAEPERLARLCGVAVGDRYRPDQVKEAERRILRDLRERRFFEADVESRWERLGTGGGRLRFDIHSGPELVLELNGSTLFSEEQVFELEKLDDRVVITDGTWREAARRLQNAYAEKGYYFAGVKLDAIVVSPEPSLKKVVRFDVREGEKYRLAEVIFHGNQVLAERELANQMETRPPSWIPWRSGFVVPQALDGDLQRIRDLYSRRGFARATARVADVRPGSEHRLTVEIAVEENRQAVIRSIDFRGLTGVELKLPSLSSSVGGPYDANAVESDRRAMVGALRSAGYLDAQVRAETLSEEQSDHDAVDLVFSAETGDRDHVGQRIVRHNADTRANVVLREMTVQPGDVIDPVALLRDQRRIYQLNLWRSVSVTPAETAAHNGVRDIWIDVRERPPGSFQWGLGYDTRDGFHGFGQVGYANLQGVGRRLSLRGEISVEPDDPEPSQYFGDLGYLEPRVLGSRWDLRTDLIGERTQREVDNYSMQRVAIVPALERSLGIGVRCGIEMIAEDAKVFDVDEDIRKEPGFHDQRTLSTVSLGPFLVRDARDDSFMPTEGTFDSLVFRYAPAYLGSEVPYVKVVAHHSHYVPLPYDLTLAYGVRGGWATTPGSNQQVPIRERFFLGGRTTVRGYGENKVGPRATRSDGGEGSPLGGDVVFNTNLELLMPPVYGVRLALFTDSGGVYLQNRQVRGEGVRETAGPGVRYYTPVGPIALDYGVKLDRHGSEAPGEIHFSIGAIF